MSLRIRISVRRISCRLALGPYLLRGRRSLDARIGAFVFTLGWR